MADSNGEAEIDLTNVGQMRKTRIEVRANITVRIDARKAARLGVDD